MTTTQTTETTIYNCKTNSRRVDFSKAVAFAKRCDGRFDADTKTWAIRSNCATLTVESGYGVDLVAFLASHGLDVVVA